MMDLIEFDWDEGNITKVSARFPLVLVETFFAQELDVIDDLSHSKGEQRFIATGKGPGDRYMFVCFTNRGTKIRVISARYMNQKEVMKYEKFKEEN